MNADEVERQIEDLEREVASGLPMTRQRFTESKLDDGLTEEKITEQWLSRLSSLRSLKDRRPDLWKRWEAQQAEFRIQSEISELQRELSPYYTYIDATLTRFNAIKWRMEFRRDQIKAGETDMKKIDEAWRDHLLFLKSEMERAPFGHDIRRYWD